MFIFLEIQKRKMNLKSLKNLNLEFLKWRPFLTRNINWELLRKSDKNLTSVCKTIEECTFDVLKARFVCKSEIFFVSDDTSALWGCWIHGFKYLILLFLVKLKSYWGKMNLIPTLNVSDVYVKGNIWWGHDLWGNEWFSRKYV